MNYFNIVHFFVWTFLLNEYQQLKNVQHLWYQLKVTIKEFNLGCYHAYLWFLLNTKCTTKRLVRFLSFHLNNLQPFFSEYQQDFSHMLILKVISAATKMTMATEEVITATTKITSKIM